MNRKKLIIVLLIVNVCQVFMSILVLTGIGHQILDSYGLAMRICLALMLLSGLVTICGLAASGLYQDKHYEETFKNLENLNRKLREQKHDYMNHFQVVYGLMELGEYEEAHHYLKPVAKEISRLNLALKTAQPAVNALLQAKLETAEKAGIDFYLEVGTDLKKIAIAPWDLCRILANLVDNAITALQETGLQTEQSAGRQTEKRLSLRMKENSDSYLFEVENNGPQIPEKNIPLLFLPGFTTKAAEGHGQGLAIVSRLVKEAGGSVSVESAPEETSFFVKLPKV